MSISAPSLDALRKLAHLMVRESVAPTKFSLRSKSGRIPKELQEKARAGWLYIDGEELESYARAVYLLSRESQLEHLSAKDIDEELWKLACELFANRGEYRDEPTLAKAISRFLDGIWRPWQDYKVIAPVEHLTTTVRALDVVGVQVMKMNRRLAAEFGLVDSPVIRDRLDELLGRTVVISSVSAGTARRAGEKGAELLDDALNALRAALVGSIYARILDEQLLFQRGTVLVVISMAEKQPAFVEWHRPFAPMGFELRRHTALPVGRHLKLLHEVASRNSPEAIRTQVLRALHWIGTSITRSSYDDKVIDLCTALETVLTTKDDRRKGEAIAIRSILLPSALDDGFFDPFVLYGLYELRSEIVHGSRIRACTRAHYERLLWDTGVLLIHYVNLVKKYPSITRPAKAIEAMETPELLTQAVQWFDGHSGKMVKDIVKVARDLLAKRQRSS
ncbi:MAG: HEPN domain-containing protein [Dehalococcoidia bacterium]|nr:HEPN domain-containing protein [Dehalococcoidia bacterium]